MQKMKKLLVFLLVACMAVSATGCGVINKAKDIANGVKDGVMSAIGEEKDVSGAYYCKKIVSDGVEEDVKELEAYGINFVMELFEDGTFKFGAKGLDEDSALGTYKVEKDKLIFSFKDSDETVEATLIDGVISLEVDETKYEFDINYIPAAPDKEKADMLLNENSQAAAENSEASEAVVENQNNSEEAPAESSQAEQPVEESKAPEASEAPAQTEESTQTEPVQNEAPAAQENNEAAPGAVVEVNGFKYKVDENGIYIPEATYPIPVFENEQFKVEMTGISVDEYWGYGLDFHLVNNSGKDVTFSGMDIAVNHVLVDASLYETVKAGKEAHVTATIYEDSLTNSAIVSIDNIGMTLNIYDSASYDDIVNQRLSFVVADPTENNIINVSDFNDDVKVVFDNEYASMVFYSSGTNDYSEFVIGAYIVNKTENTNLMFSLDDCSINNIMLDPFWAKSVPAGTAAVSEIRWNLKDIEKVGIKMEDPWSFELPMRVSDADNWFADSILEETFTYEVE